MDGYKQKRGHICSTLDDLRYQLSVSSDKASNQLPPTEDSFRLHMMRAMYQAHIWRSSNCANIVCKDPQQYGWVEGKDKCMRPGLMMKEPAPLEVRNLTHLFLQ